MVSRLSDCGSGGETIYVLSSDNYLRFNVLPLYSYTNYYLNGRVLTNQLASAISSIIETRMFLNVQEVQYVVFF